MAQVYKVLHATPSSEVYRALRLSAGLSGKSEAAAAIGLANTLFAVQIIVDAPAFDPTAQPTTIGMGRVIGDGGCFFQVVDIAVDPAHQGKGLGKRIMGEIRAWLDVNVPEGGFVSLLADGKAHALYEQFGFEQTAPASVGMAWLARA